jgi:iron complex outermembrane recepter protein
MQTPSPRRFVHCAHAPFIIAVWLALAPLGAQTLPPPRPTEPVAKDLIELSPFVVAENDEVGYVATSSLAGSRVKTELKDIASQIDILTPEFLNDIGAQNIADAVVYSSNFGGPTDQNINANDGVGSTKLEARARGMDQATLSSDFFTTNLPSDFYNVERLNLAYGAQSVLFGLGNAGGVLDSATKRAQMKNTAVLEWRGDSWDSRRAILDLNRQLLPRKLALRLVGLDSDGRSFTEGGRNRQQRIFATATLRPFQSTTVRASYERVDQQIQVATNYVSYDLVSPWVAAGRPRYDNSRGNASITAADLLFARNTNALRVLAYGTEAGSLQPWNGSAATQGPHQLPGVVDPRRPSLLDSSIFPVEVDPRVRSRQNDIRGSIGRAFVEQKISPDLFVEFAANFERRRERSGGTFNNVESIEIRGDPNQYLPGGTAARPQTALNPNAGKLFLETFPNGSRSTDQTREARVTGLYEFDAGRKLGERRGWLGRHRIALHWSLRQDISKAQDARAVVVGETPFTTGDKSNNSRLLRMRYYLDSPSDPNSPGNYQAGPVPGSGIHGPWTLTDPATGTPYQVALFDNPDGQFFVPVGAKLEDETRMIAWQSYFFRNRLTGFVGLRRDHVKTYSFIQEDLERMDQLAPGDRRGLYRPFEVARFSSSPDATASTVMGTYGVVVHALPWLSFFYNRSENTSLPPGRLDPWGAQLPGVSSNGFDWGARVSLLRDRLALRLNVYEDNQTDFWSNPFQALRDTSATIERRLRGDDRPAGIGPVPASTFDPVSYPVSLYRSVSEKTARGGDAVLVANLTSQWDLRMTVGYQRNVVVSRSKAWMEWIEQRLPVWREAGGLGWDNVTITSTNSRTIRQHYEQNIVTEIASLQMAVGTQRFREREWRSNLFTNYRFAEGWRKGLSLGGGARWWGPANTGNGSIMVPGIADPVVNPRILHRDARSQVFVDTVIAYRRPFVFRGSRLGTRLQLNVRNLLDENDLEVARSNYAGQPFEFLRVAPRQISLTAGLTY